MANDYENRKKITAFRLIVSTIILLVLALTWGLFMRGSLRAMEIDSSSMEPTLAVHDRLIVKFNTKGPYHRNEIVIISPPNGESGPDFIKRIVAVPGDKVEFRSGLLYVNGEISPPPDGRAVSHDLKYATYNLAPGEYFVMGDNRAKSLDSEEFGPIDESLIRGVPLYRYSPRARMGSVE